MICLLVGNKDYFTLHTYFTLPHDDDHCADQPADHPSVCD